MHWELVMARFRLDITVVLLWLATFLGALIATHLLRSAHFPVGWNYLALFLLSSTASFFSAGIYRWTFAAWGGALVMLAVGTLRLEGYLATPPGLLAAQYLPAALTGALLGEWLRYRLNKARNTPFDPEPSLHVLVAAVALLVLLPLLTFLYASTLMLVDPHLIDFMMFAPNNTPFLFPSLITALLCGLWLRSKEVAAPRSDKRAALVLIVVAIVLMVVAIFTKVVFGIVEVA